MFKSLVTVHGWVEEFRQHMKEKYGEIAEVTENMLEQLKVVLEAFDQSCILSITDTKGRIIEVNNTYCEISGYSREELLGKTHYIVNAKYHDENFFKDMWTTIQNGGIWSGEVKNKRKDGTDFWVKTMIFPIFDSAGNPEKFLSIRTDITAGKTAGEKLREVIEHDYSTLINNLHNFVIRTKWNKNGPEVTFIAGRLAKEIGLHADKVKGKLVTSVIGDTNQQPLIKKQFRNAFEGKTIKFDYKEGKRYYHATLSPVQNENNHVIEVIASISDITDLKNSELAVRNMAYHDPLTGLPNRRLLEEDLVYRILEAKVHRKKAGLILVNLDQFKNINDTLGHSAGDRFIMMAAERMQNITLDNYVNEYQLYHIGGDEFVWFIYDFEEIDLLNVVDLVINVFQEPFYYNSGEFHQRASIGISVYPNSAGYAEELLKHADMALMAAKQAGGQTYRFFSSDMKGAFLSRVQMEVDLREAIRSGNQFELYYQPVIRVSDNSLSSCEALIRWNHPERGFVSPVEFIKTAEDSGLIIPIGDWVIQKAFEDLRNWELIYKKKIDISINISPSQLQQSGFVRRIKEMADYYEISPTRIQLEITENGLMENTLDSINTLHKLKELGFYIAVDDFGTGYSSLSYLKQFPVHCLKIDKSFVRDLPGDRADRAIVSSTIKMGKDLGLFTVAEGVECEEAYKYLSSIGCPYVQGFHFSRPIPARKFVKLFQQKTIRTTT
ncbi:MULTISPECIES: EAL and GGDEF domain-containing protein [Bacillaceae]|uniref:EAL domain-containing protein n=1 Tax=Evansella alkalicola TaxID=745819 RepID=A0ABS6JRI1_9BACI|nr:MULTISPECIES: EAL domain-containing protein [Bacillaceae]MBU9721168.1 EAL domain-containing protein [Bacillus alkalicola]